MTPTPADNTLWLSLRTYTATRLAIASIVLVGYTVLQWRTVGDGVMISTIISFGLVYCVGGFVFAFLASRVPKYYGWQVFIQIAWDLLALTLFLSVSGGLAGGLALLFLVPIAATALLTSTVFALFCAAVASLLVFIEVFYEHYLIARSAEINWPAAGLHGMAFFMGALLTSRLAERALRQEEAARTASAQLARQYAVNELVVAQLEVPVLAIQGTLVSLANPAAAREFGTQAAVGQPAPTELLALIEQWRSHARTPFAPATTSSLAIARPELPMQISVNLANQRSASYTVTLSSLHSGASDNNHSTVLAILQNIQHIEDRAQELKLASMGRLTASIAHEIRNPLAAIAHAAALLREESGKLPTEQPEHALQRRLSNIVMDNTQRLNRMVEDILLLARKERSTHQIVPLAQLAQDIAQELIEQMPELDGRIELAVPQHVQMRFDADHLRRVLINLLNNAHRYATSASNAIKVGASADETIIQLWVSDDGPTLSKEVLEHLFEPFFTTHSKGTGLGLYITRELCLYNRAQLHYSDPSQGAPFKGFVITQATSQLQWQNSVQ